MQLTYPPIAVSTGKNSWAYCSSLGKEKYSIALLLDLQIRHLGYLVAQRVTSYQLMQLISLCQRGLLCCILSLQSLNHLYFVVVEWVLTFEFQFGKAGSRQNNIIDCTRYCSSRFLHCLTSSFFFNFVLMLPIAWLSYHGLSYYEWYICILLQPLNIHK